MRRRRDSEDSTCYSTTPDEQSQTEYKSNANQDRANQLDTNNGHFTNQTKMQNSFLSLCDCLRVQNVHQQESLSQVFIVVSQKQTADRFAKQLDSLFNKYIKFSDDYKQNFLSRKLLQQAVSNIKRNDKDDDFKEFVEKELEIFQDADLNVGQQSQYKFVMLLKRICNRKIEIDKQVPKTVYAMIITHLSGKDKEKYLKILPNIKQFLKEKKNYKGFLQHTMDNLRSWKARIDLGNNAERTKKILDEIAFQLTHRQQLDQMELPENTENSR